MPTSALGLLVVLALVPGYFYLRLTKDVHRPQEQSSTVADVLEVATAGIVTTGGAVLLAALALPGRVAHALHVLQEPTQQLSGRDVRYVGIASLCLVVCAVGFAYLASRSARRVLGSRYSASVMRAALGKPEQGHRQAVGVWLADGSTVDGFLHAYSLADDPDTRSVALSSPLRRQTADGQVTHLPFDYFLAFGEEIRHVVVKNIPRKSDASSEPG
jgi:hypothetical protein